MKTTEEDPNCADISNGRSPAAVHPKWCAALSTNCSSPQFPFFSGKSPPLSSITPYCLSTFTFTFLLVLFSYLLYQLLLFKVRYILSYINPAFILPPFFSSLPFSAVLSKLLSSAPSSTRYQSSTWITECINPQHNHFFYGLCQASLQTSFTSPLHLRAMHTEPAHPIYSSSPTDPLSKHSCTTSAIPQPGVHPDFSTHIQGLSKYSVQSPTAKLRTKIPEHLVYPLRTTTDLRSNSLHLPLSYTT